MMVWQVLIDDDVVGFFPVFVRALDYVRTYGADRRVSMSLIEICDVTVSC